MNREINEYILRQIEVGGIQTNCYIFGSKLNKEVAIIDPGADYEKIKAILDRDDLKPVCIINTHGHVDHIGANSRFNLPIYIHKEDADFLTDPKLNLSAFYGGSVVSPEASRTLSDGDRIDISDVSLRVIHTPGHTPGGISLKYDDILFAGDTLFANGVGRTDFPYGDSDKLMISIREKLMVLEDKVVVLPGHGLASTIGKERN
ncbi:MBL fold metallo-hydrolase, partial [Candidatus Omnitrophota bacterium]